MQIKKILEFVTFENNTNLQTKFGGQPDWIDEPQWPISKELGQPMRFIGQVNLGEAFPEYDGKLAYIFMTEHYEEYVDGTWEPDGGENAIIIQPHGDTTTYVQAIKNGPSREEFGIKVVEKEIEDDELEGCRIGGSPEFMQGEEYPEPKEEWVFLAQLDSCTLPFEVNFGDAGIGYAFINKSATKGKFLWQCG